MAAIDKIYGTQKQWHTLYDFLLAHKPEYLRHLYPQPPPSKSEEFPISNFPIEADEWLLKNCKIEFVLESIKEQYGIV